MTPLYMLDTNIVSYVVKANPPIVGTRVAQHSSDSLIISAITAAELRYWIAKRPLPSRTRFHIEDFLARVPTLPWDANVAAVHGELKASLFTAGRPLAELDRQIAAHALALQAVLVSHDGVFRQVPNLKVEDWTLPA